MVCIHLPSGLRYHVLQPPRWNAPSPARGDTVAIRYSGWVNDNGVCGTALYDDDMADFPVAHGVVIDGIDTGVLTMRKGEKRRFFIPADLAYGAHGDGALVPPHTDIICDVELYDIR